jgi:hypothetical protein
MGSKPGGTEPIFINPSSLALSLVLSVLLALPHLFLGKEPLSTSSGVKCFLGCHTLLRRSSSLGRKGQSFRSKSGQPFHFQLTFRVLHMALSVSADTTWPPTQPSTVPPPNSRPSAVSPTNGSDSVFFLHSPPGGGRRPAFSTWPELNTRVVAATRLSAG